MSIGANYGAYWQPPSSLSGYSPGASYPAYARANAEIATARASTIEDAGIRAGEIIAHRAWILTPTGKLRSMFVDDYVWTPRGIEDAGEDFRWRGIHAFKTLDQAIEHYYCYSASHTVVFGEVALWGNIIEHERGYRAQFAQVKKIHKIFDFHRKHRRWWWEFWMPRDNRIQEIERLYV